MAQISAPSWSEAGDAQAEAIRADAISAATLAEAAAETAATLVEVNLGTLAGDPRIERARQLHRRAAEARQRASAAAAPVPPALVADSLTRMV
jgi:formiminotetrahydrofolate cyclodeaminase